MGLPGNPWFFAAALRAQAVGSRDRRSREPEVADHHHLPPRGSFSRIVEGGDAAWTCCTVSRTEKSCLVCCSRETFHSNDSLSATEKVVFRTTREASSPFHVRFMKPPRSDTAPAKSP